MKNSRLQSLLQRRLARYDIEYLREYADTLGRLLETEGHRVECRLNETAASLPAEDHDEYLSDRSEEYQ